MQVSGLPSLLEVMQLVSGRGQDGADNNSSASTELTGSSDPLRITARHALSLQQRTLTVTLDVYNRLPVDVRNAFIRRALSAELAGAPRGDKCLLSCAQSVCHGLLLMSAACRARSQEVCVAARSFGAQAACAEGYSKACCLACLLGCMLAPSPSALHYMHLAVSMAGSWVLRA